MNRSASESDVLDSLGDAVEDGEAAVLVTVVDVEGNAYRRPGAKMLVDRESGELGHITAGCLEDQVRELAADVLDAGRPRIETYDLMEDDDVWGLGVGCNGIIDVLLEPVDERHAPLTEAVAEGDPVAVCTVIDGDPELGAKAFHRDGELDAGEGFPAWLAASVSDVAADLLADGDSTTVEVDTDHGSATVFVDAVRPSPDLLVFGSGHDVTPVVEQARRAGFRVTVVGYRGAVDLRARFPDADAVVSTSPGTVTEDVSLDENSYAVVMTHNFVDDRLTVEALLKAGVPYVGLMGPRERFEEMLDAFEEEGWTPSDAQLEPLYTPVGLDLGAGSPYGIATSIVAELLAVHNDRDPGHLTHREGPIHDRADPVATD
jgi:xanthine dehydrogenase accessory factor